MTNLDYLFIRKGGKSDFQVICDRDVKIILKTWENKQTGGK
jgi:hypothetical protein